MRRPILVLVLCVLPLSSQTKKVLVEGNPALAAELAPDVLADFVIPR